MFQRDRGNTRKCATNRMEFSKKGNITLQVTNLYIPKIVCHPKVRRGLANDDTIARVITRPSRATREGPPLSRPDNVLTSVPPGVPRACLQLPRLPHSRVRPFPPDDIVSVTQLVPLRTATPAVTRQQIKVDAGSARSSVYVALKPES